MQTIDLTREQIIAILDEEGVEHEDFDGYHGMDDISEADAVATALINAHLDLPLSFAWECSPDGEISMGSGGVYVKGLYLVDSVDRKNITDDREATGTDAAVAYATGILALFNKAIRVATSHGLAA